MHPRTVLIIVALILGLAIGLRFLVLRTGFLPVNEEVVLKKAVVVRVTYTRRGNPNTVHISDPDELGELMSVLHLRRDRDDMYFGGPRMGGGGGINSVDFLFPNGMARNTTMAYATQLGNHEVDPRFHAKLCEIVSRHEGRHINILLDNP